MIHNNNYPLGFLANSTWFSEALLPTAFKARYRGDPLSESRTNADVVIGHFVVGKRAKTDLELKEKPAQFTVVEAKIAAPLSKGVSNAKYFDQAARNVACMAEVIARAGVNPASFSRLDFIVLAPRHSIEQGTFSEEMERGSIRSKVKRRVSEYGGELDTWYKNHLIPNLDRIELHSISWEDAIEWIGSEKDIAAQELSDFYNRCLEFN